MLQKVEHYCKAVDRLSEAIPALTQNPDSSIIRDGIIQRFEFTFELAWKSLREYMEDQGADMSGIVFSKQVFKAAYSARIISNDEVWLAMLHSRNITSHVYDDVQAAAVAADICNKYMEPLSALADFYRAQ